MIFVTVGTHEQPFNRIIEAVDSLLAKGIIDEQVLIQRGYSTTVPKFCTSVEMLPYGEMVAKIKEARIVVTHGGVGTMMEVLKMGKVPVVVPRQARFGEHVNDHQISFVWRFEKLKKILAVYDIEKLEEIIINFDNLAQKCKPTIFQGEELDKLIKNLIAYCQTLQPSYNR